MEDLDLQNATVQAIKDSEKTVYTEIGGVNYTTREVFLLPEEPEYSANPLWANTLDSIVDYILGEPDTDESLLVQVMSPTAVRIISSVKGLRKVRDIYMEATAIVPEFRFGDYMPMDVMLIEMRTGFLPLDEFASTVSFLSKVRADESIEQNDDGVSQSVVVKTGVAGAVEMTAPETVKLRPYRTFSEVQQPMSEFILRLRKVGPTLQAALFESDGGKWRLDAIQNVAEYLRKKLDGQLVLA